VKQFLFFLCIGSLSLAAEIKVTALSGSLRKDSYNKKLVDQAAKIAQQMGASVTVIDLKDYPMPLYDGDLEASQGMPEAAKKLRRLLLESDAILISTPEYNGSISAALKNAIDWASRTEQGQSSKEVFKGKKFALLSASPGKMGGSAALNHLRFILERLGGEVIEKQVSVGSAFLYFEGKEPLDLAPLKEEIKDLLRASAQ
jgi:chromate reductase